MSQQHWPDVQLPGVPPEQQDHSTHLVPPLPPRWLRKLLFRRLFRDLGSKRDRRYNR